MFRFNANTHTATKICISSADYYACADRRFGTESEMIACPEFQAFEACNKAYFEASTYLPVELRNKLGSEVAAWKEAACRQQLPVNNIAWKLDDWYMAGGMAIILQNREFVIEIDRSEEKIHFYNEDGYEFASFAYYAYKADLGSFYVTNGVSKLWFTFAK